MSESAALLSELPADGPSAPPRANGELIFAAPWEGRAFGLAVSLAEDGVFTLAEFQAELIAAIARWEAEDKPVEEYHYYECWLAALEQLVIAKTSVSAPDIDARTEEFLARPAGHDHDHDHGDHTHDDHGHDHHH